MPARSRSPKKRGKGRGRGRSRDDVVQHEQHEQYAERLKQLADPQRQGDESRSANPLVLPPKKPGSS